MSSTARASRVELVGLALADEDDVDVAGVVELAAAELAHADDGQVVGAGQPHGGARARRRPASASAAAVASRSSRPVRSRAAMRSSSRRFQAARLGAVGAVLGRPRLVEVGEDVERRRGRRRAAGQRPAGAGDGDQGAG